LKAGKFIVREFTFHAEEEDGDVAAKELAHWRYLCE
jgi:hypothetical protein